MSTTLEFNKITDEERSTLGVSALSDRPNETGLYGVGGLNAKELKNWFDKFANLLANKFNAFCGIFNGENGADVAQYIKLNFGGYETMRDVLTGIENGSFANVMMAYASASAENTSSLQSILNSMAESISKSLTPENFTDYIVDNLTTDDVTKALSAKQGKALKAIADLKIDISSIADNLTTNDANKVLSAKQGKKLNDEKIDKTSIADNLTTDDNTKVLSAKQGKALDNKKVEKYTTADGKKYAYTVDNGVQGKTEITETPTAAKLPVYGANGGLKAGNPASDSDSSDDVANVRYVRGKINGLNLDMVMDNSTYKIKSILKEGNTTIAESNEIDLPLETLVTSLSYNGGNIIATLKNGNKMEIPITDVIEDSDFYYILMYKYIPWMFNIPTVSSDLDLRLSGFSRMPVVGENFVLFLNKRIPIGSEHVVVDTFIAQCHVRQIILDNNDPNSMNSMARSRIEDIYSIKGNTGAKLLSQTLTGYDSNGNAEYQQQFDDGTIATFISPKGKPGRALFSQLVISADPLSLMSSPSQQLSIESYFSSSELSLYPLYVGEQFYAIFEYNTNSYLAVCEIVSLTSTQFTYRVVNYSSIKGIKGDKGDTGLTFTTATPTIDFEPKQFDVYSGGDGSGAGDYVGSFNRTPVVGEIYTKYYNYNGQNGVITYMVTQVITAIDSTTGGITAQVQDVHVLTGAVPVSTTFVGTDANGGNVYSISFSNGTTATITAPKGEGSSIGLFNGKSIDRYIFNKRISINQLEAYFSTLTYENGVSLLVDTIAGIGVYAVRMSDLDASGSGYAIAVVTVEVDGAKTINEIVFFSQYSLANVAIAQNALGDETFTFDEAGWLGNGYYVLPSQTQVDGSVDVAVNSFVSSDNSFWDMVYDLVDEDITTAKNGVTALHTEIDSFVLAHNPVGTEGLTFTYDDTNGTAVCTGGSVSGDIVIPAYVKNYGKWYKVTKIGDNAFQNNTNITYVIIPISVWQIGNHAFQGCTSLSKISIGTSESANYIRCEAEKMYFGDYAFSETAIMYVDIKCLYIRYGNHCFQNCTKLEIFEDNSNSSFYAYQSFYGCTALTTVYLRAVDTFLFRENFYGCSSLRNITFNEHVSVNDYFNLFKDTSNVTLTVLHKDDKSLPSTDKDWLTNNGVTLVEYFYGTKKYIHKVSFLPTNTNNAFRGHISFISNSPDPITSLTSLSALTTDDLLTYHGTVNVVSQVYPIQAINIANSIIYVVYFDKIPASLTNPVSITIPTDGSSNNYTISDVVTSIL